MTLLLLPFLLVWLGVMVNMPICYYVLIGLMTLFDVGVTFYEKGRKHGQSRNRADDEM